MTTTERIAETRRKLRLLKEELGCAKISRHVWRVKDHTIYQRDPNLYEVRPPKHDRERYGMKPYFCTRLIQALTFVAYNSAYPKKVDYMESWADGPLSDNDYGAGPATTRFEALLSDTDDRTGLYGGPDDNNHHSDWHKMSGKQLIEHTRAAMEQTGRNLGERRDV